MDEVDELTEVVEFKEEAVLTGKLDGLVEVDGLPEEETDPEGSFSAAEPVPELAASLFAALHPADRINSADKQIKSSLLIFIRSTPP